MKTAIKVSLLILLAWSTGIGIAKAQNPLRFEPEVVTLSGICLGNFVMGDWGEMARAYVLHLDEPVSIEGNAGSSGSKQTVNDVTQILLEPPQDADWNDMMGKRVRLEGKLFHSPSEYHHTEVLMKVSKVLEVKGR